MKKLFENSTCKKVLVSLLALAMVIGTVSMTIFAATQSTGAGDQDSLTVLGGSWDLVSTTKGDYSEHKICDHKDGHTDACYLPVATYQQCSHTDGTMHNGVAVATDVVSINLTTRVATWDVEHPAYPAVKAAYDELIGVDDLSSLTMMQLKIGRAHV